MQRVRSKLQYTLFRQSWNIAITPHPVAVVAGLEGRIKQRQALNQLQWMSEQRAAFAADPFIVARPGKPDDFLVFYEHFPWSQGRGCINCVEFSNGAFGAPILSMGSPYHLSYPYILAHSDTLFMLPEHSEARDLCLYKFDDTGLVCHKETLFRNIELIDSSILHWQDKYWLFATHAGPDELSALYIYHANELEGPWLAHAENPVKLDASNARPAGQFIRHGNGLFRPAQDCQSHYGAGVVINEIKVLTEYAFEEIPVSDIRPELGWRCNYGLHTISSADDYTVIDGARIESTLHSSLDRLGQYFVPKV